MGSIISNANIGREIEEIVTKQREKSYIDAVLMVCEKYDIEPDSIAKVLDKPTIERLMVEYGSRNYIRNKPKGKLPI
jgi:hypothetical protein